MKQCISRLIRKINHLWRTLKEYVRKKTRNHVRFQDVDNDLIDEIVIDINSDINLSEYSVTLENNNDKEEKKYDTKSNSCESTSRDS